MSKKLKAHKMSSTPRYKKIEGLGEYSHFRYERGVRNPLHMAIHKRAYIKFIPVLLKPASDADIDSATLNNEVDCEQLLHMMKESCLIDDKKSGAVLYNAYAEIFGGRPQDALGQPIRPDIVSQLQPVIAWGREALKANPA